MAAEQWSRLPALRYSIRQLILGMALVALAELMPAQTTKPSRVALYTGVGHELTHYEVDVAGAKLVRRDSVTVSMAELTTGTFNSI